MKTSKMTFRLAVLGVLGLSTLVGTTFPAQAKTTNSSTTKAHNGPWQKLNLSADQKARIKSLETDRKARIQNVKNNTALSPAAQKAQIKAIHDDTKSRINAILTPAQQAQLKNFRQDKRGEKSGERKFAKLNLNADQQARMKSIRQSAQAQVAAVRNNTSLSPEQQKTQMRAIRRDSMQRANAILTPEQRAQLMQMRRDRRGNRKGGGDGPSNYSRPGNGGLNG